MSRVQTLHYDIEWRRMRDHDTYYPLRDGPRLYRGETAIETLAKYLPDDHVHLGRRLAALHARVHSGGSSEIAERVQGGNGLASREHRLRKLSNMIRELAGFESAALFVGKDGHGCFRGICVGDTQAELMRRVRYPQGSRRTLRKLVQITMIALSEHADRRGLDLCTEIGERSSQ